MIRGIENVICSSFAFISIPNRLKVFISSHEIRIPYISQIPDMSDLSRVFEVDDIFTRMEDITGLKSSPWAGLGKPVNTHQNCSAFRI